MWINVLHVQLAPWLKWSSIRVEVKVGNRLFNAHTESHALLGKCMDGIHKPSILRWESVSMRHSLKQWTCRIQTYIQTRQTLNILPLTRNWCKFLSCSKCWLRIKILDLMPFLFLFITPFIGLFRLTRISHQLFFPRFSQTQLGYSQQILIYERQGYSQSNALFPKEIVWNPVMDTHRLVSSSKCVFINFLQLVNKAVCVHYCSSLGSGFFFFFFK